MNDLEPSNRTEPAVPPLTRWFIKTAILYFVAALVLGVGLATEDAIRLPVSLGPLRPTYLHLLTLGWITQMIFGVAFWMFPRASRERPRGPEGPAIASYLLLNAGLLLRWIAEPLQVLQQTTAAGPMLIVSATLQWLAGVLFVVIIWGRVKAK